MHIVWPSFNYDKYLTLYMQLWENPWNFTVCLHPYTLVMEVMIVFMKNYWEMCRDKTIIGLSQKFIAVVKFLFYISSVSFESIFKSNLVHASFVSSNSDFFYYLLNVSCIFKSLSEVIKSNKTITFYFISLCL